MDDNDNPLDRAEDLIAQGRAAEAAGLVRTLIESGRGGLLARLVLARAWIAAGEKGLAVMAAHDAASYYPGVAQAALGLGETLLAAGLLPAAIAELQRALRIDPSLDPARLKLAEAWLVAGEAVPALDVLGQVEAQVGGASVATLVAQAEAMRARPRCDPGYVRHLFDQFSNDYDQRMRGHLGYRGPEILRELAQMIGLGLAKHEILDLGCGTGLAGVAFADMAARLDGIDLSPAMVRQAGARQVYTDLIVGDLETELGEIVRRYDLLIAADTFVYLGDLSHVFREAARLLRGSGHMLFTVESSPAPTYDVGSKRRWRHSESYLRALAAESGFAVVGLLACTPRHEAGRPVEGFAVALRKI